MTISMTKYKFPYGQYYISTNNLENGGIFISEDYFRSSTFEHDFLYTLVYNYPDVLLDIIETEGSFLNNLTYYNKVFSKVNAVQFLRQMTDSIISEIMLPSEIKECVTLGIFPFIQPPYTKLIQIIVKE